MRSLPLLMLLLCFLVLPATVAADAFEDPEFVYRQPASLGTPDRDQLLELSGSVTKFVDHKTVQVESTDRAWQVGDVLAVKSQFDEAGVIAFLEVVQIKNEGRTKVLKCELLRGTRKNFVQIGDSAFRVDLTKASSKYKGSTELLVRKTSDVISSKYHYLVTQGVTIGETAQTLQEGEYLATWYSHLYYGLKPNLMLSTVLLANMVGAPNVQTKWRFFESESNIFSLALNAAKVPTEPRTLVNATLYWDSISSESVISHTYLSLALLSFEDTEDKTAVKAFGSSSIQTGYEFIQDDWNRILVGPSYSFENKAVGGYLGYMKIWDRFHFLLALNSTDITKFTSSTSNGYFLFFDAYWRF